MTTPFKLRSHPSPFQQKLSRKAAEAKKKRDIEAASTPERIAKRSENQSIGQSSDYDLHHKPDGTVVRMSVANNRNVWQHGERTA
tara:strand:- start:61 stop:315 length:255 start_codon:yes stop_codon:yes gene_type:complete